MARENGYRVEPGYSTRAEFISIRPKLISLAEHYSLNLRQPLLPVVAVSYGDRFLSVKGLPVMQGIGFKRTLQIFTFTCLVIAMERSNQDFDFPYFVGLHLGNEVEVVRRMKSAIEDCLGERLRPMIALEPIPVLINFAIINDEQPLPIRVVHYITVGMHKDIRFTEYKLSTVAASAILAASHTLYPNLHPLIEDKLFKSKLVDKTEVRRCLKDLKDHVVISHILGPQRVSGAILAQDKGKQPLINFDWRAQQRQWNLVDMDLTWFES